MSENARDAARAQLDAWDYFANLWREEGIEPPQEFASTAALRDLLALTNRLGDTLADAWDAGHRHRQRRDWNDGCKCAAYSEGECACGLYGTGALISLRDNPYRDREETVVPHEGDPDQGGRYGA